MQHAVIMAGGAGIRLWPLSRKSRPKQLLHLFGDASLLRLSYERVAGLLPVESINIITAAQHLPLVGKEIPELPAENLLGEPVGRDTANAVALAAAVLVKRDPDAVIATFTADHVITPLDKFRAAVAQGLEAAQEHGDALVTFGIKPARPETQFGYVRRGDQVQSGVYQVRQFAEKPDLRTATDYVRSGEYYWNSGMFAWRADTILAQLKQHLPASQEAVLEIAEVWGTDKQDEVLARLYPTLDKISIDFAVMEHAPRVLVVEMDCRWLDVGSWPALAEVVKPDVQSNVPAAKRMANLRAHGNVVVSEDDHLIATLGVEDLVIVHAPDATLICHKSEAAAVKELFELVKERFGEDYA